jgi:hypothetical protein
LRHPIRRAAPTHLIETGVGSVCLWVYDANTAAINFYSLGKHLLVGGVRPKVR